MINIAYFKQIFKSNLKFLIAFTLVLCLFTTVMISVFTPETIKSIQETTKETIASHILTGDGTLIGFMANSFYALMAIIFPMVFSIMVANRLIAEKIDKSSMVGFLSTPITRLQIVLTSIIYLVLSLVLMWMIVSMVGIFVANKLQPDALDIDKYLTLNVGVLLYQLSISSICFLSSCIFNTSASSLAFGAGIPLFFFVISLMIKLSDNLDYLKYLTLNTLFDPLQVISEGDYLFNYLLMGVISLVLYSISIVVFNKKDLPI